MFILVAEILSLKLKSNKNAKGLTINYCEYKVIHLADDTTIFMNDIASFTVAIKLFLDFETVAGPKINLEKCEIIELGPMNLENLIMPDILSNLQVNKILSKH